MGQKRANSGGGSSSSSRSRSRSRNSSSSSSGGGGGSSMTKTKTKVKAGGGSTAAGVGAAAALNDERFRLFLQNADEIESIEHFRYWKDEFFHTYRPYLDPLGLATAREADEDLYLQLEKLARVCVDTKTLVKEGKITPERSTVRGQKSVNEMIAATDICEQHIDRYFPKTRDEEALCGYTKFELAAVLVRDGFRIYGLMVATRDYMQGLIGEGGPLAQVLKSNQLSMIRFYFRCLDTFSTTMADLGMFKLMTRCEELYKVRPRCRRRKNNNNNNNNNQKKTKANNAANNSTANNSTANNNKRFDKNGTKDALSDTSEGSGGDFINGGRMFRKSKQKYRAIMNKGWTNGLFKGQQITGPKEQQQQQLPPTAAAAAKKKKKKKKKEEEDKKKKKEDNDRDNNRDKDKPKRKSKKKKKNGGHYPCHNHGHNHGHNHNHSNEPQPQDDDVHHESTALGEKENNRGGREGGRGKLDIYMSSQDTSLSSIDIRSLDCTCTADSTLDEHMSSASFTEDEDIFDDDYESESEEEEVEDPESDTEEEEEEDFIYYFDPVRRIVGKVSRKKCLAENLVVGIDPATGAERTEGAIDEWDSKGDQIGKTDLILQLKEILRGQAKDKVDGLD